MIHVLFASFFLALLTPLSAAACQMFADEPWFDDADIAGQPCDLGDDHVTLGLVDYTDMERMIIYQVNWHQDPNLPNCQRWLELRIATTDATRDYKMCDVEFPLDRLTESQLHDRLQNLTPLFESGGTDGKEIILAIKRKL